MAAKSPITVARFWSKVSVGDAGQCWRWTASQNAKGYGAFQGQKAHRIAFEIINGEIPDGLLVMHKCDNPSCCNPAHLMLGTAQDNAEDMVSKGRNVGWAASGNNPKLKLTPEQILEIRSSPERGVVLAQKYGVAASTISMVRRFHRR